MLDLLSRDFSFVYQRIFTKYFFHIDNFPRN